GGDEERLDADERGGRVAALEGRDGRDVVAEAALPDVAHRPRAGDEVRALLAGEAGDVVLVGDRGLERAVALLAEVAQLAEGLDGAFGADQDLLGVGVA